MQRTRPCCGNPMLSVLAVALLIVATDRLPAQPPATSDQQSVPTQQASVAPLSVEEIVDRVRPSLVTIRTQGREGGREGIGTGFVISSDGLIATNLHVIGEGRPFTVELADGRRLKVLGIEASDHTFDLAVVRVAVDSQRPLPALAMRDSEARQGTSVVAMGNPWGLRESVVDGVVSAVRMVDGRELLQLAMPIEPGNSGGPVVDRSAAVVGVVNMKSTVQDNVAFAVQTAALRTMLDKRNPVDIQRWITIGKIDDRKWVPLYGADWRQRGGRIVVSGTGSGFGGRSLCLSTAEVPGQEFDLAVHVRLGNESGAAGLIFHSDERDKHYGFYPTNGKLRLTCFQGPTVYSWKILADIDSEHYRPGEWNLLKVRVREGQLECYVNHELVLKSRDRTFTEGKVGLAKFRDTVAEFKGFRVAAELVDERPDIEQLARIADTLDEVPAAGAISLEQLEEFSATPLARRALLDKARRLDHQARQLRQSAEAWRRIAKDVHVRQVGAELAALVEADDERVDLLRGALLIAKFEELDIEVDGYVDQVDRMADEVRSSLPAETQPEERLAALDNYLFAQNGYHGSRFDYYQRANSFMNRVIDDREGLPITLSVLYMELARRLDLTVHGIGLPGHFVVQFVPEEGAAQLIDVFDRGKKLKREDADGIVQRYTGERLTDEMLVAATATEILTRMLRNLLARTDRDIESRLRYLEGLVALKSRFSRATGAAYSGQCGDGASCRRDRRPGVLSGTQPARAGSARDPRLPRSPAAGAVAHRDAGRRYSSSCPSCSQAHR